MIPFDFEYYRPDSLEEAYELYYKLNLQKKSPIYYGGGTEFISMARMNNRKTGAVIDIKAIPECNNLEISNENLVLGSALTLTQISESDCFPLLSYIVRRIADHTIQGKITLGGNLLGTIIYKETMLPLLLTNSRLMIYGFDGIKIVSIMDIYNKKINLKEGEILVQIMVDERFLSLPFRHVKRTKHEKIDYPLITMAAIKDKDKILLAFSGLCQYPIRSYKLERIINNFSLKKEENIREIVENIPGEIVHDISGSSQYRKFILSDMLLRIFDKFQEVN